MREHWGSRSGFILAAVFLGNIWRFAYVADENDRGANLSAARRLSVTGPKASEAGQVVQQVSGERWPRDPGPCPLRRSPSA